MKKTTIIACLAGIVALLTGACTRSNSGSLLEGTLPAGTETDFAVNYLPDGNIFEARTIDITPDSTGHYTFDMELPEGSDAVDVEVLIGQDIFGAYLQRGKTTRLDFKRTADDAWECTFGGDNADVSRAVADAAKTYDLFSLQGESYASARAITDERHKQAQASCAAIADATLRDYYTRLEQARYTGTVLRLLQDRALEEGCKASDFPEFGQLMATIDPNSDIDFIAANSILWVMNATQTPEPAFKGDYSARSIELIDIAEQRITNPKLRRQLAYAIPNMFFAYGDHETGKEAFWERYKAFAKDFPEYIEAFQGEYEKVVSSMNGKPIPELTLERPDGTKVGVDALRGKVTYIDIWATWCGPCCKEIPFVEKLVEQMRGNDRLQFVSFSVDTDRAAWQAKLDNDKPAWQQFILDAENNKILSDALSITGIPRFIILGPDGTIIDEDAKRPSDPELAPYLEELTAQ